MPALTSPAAVQMRAWLDRATARYRRSLYLNNIYQGQGVELDQIREGVADALAQTFVGLATWTLGDWEAEAGLVFDPALTTAQRRERLIAHFVGTGTATVAVVKAVAETFEGGQSAVIEHQDAYRIIIRFISTHGIPPDLAGVEAALRAVVPANTIIEYEFNFTTWDNWGALALDWDAVDALALTWDQHAVYA